MIAQMANCTWPVTCGRRMAPASTKMTSDGMGTQADVAIESSRSAQ